MNNVHPAFTGILANFSTQHDRLTKLERRNENLDDMYADCTSILADLACAMNLVDVLAYADADMEEAYSLLDKAQELVAKKLAKIESGSHD